MKRSGAGFVARRGTNISHWLSQSDRRGAERAARFQRVDVRRLAEWGFDHVRLPVDEEQLWSPDGKQIPEAVDLLEQALDWCEEDGLRAVVDLHVLRTHSFAQDTEPELFTDPRAAEKFAALWEDLSGVLRRRSRASVAYELLNEAVASYPQSWNWVARIVHRRLRFLEPLRTLIIGSNRWNSVQTFGELDVPEDENTVLTFHYYHPMLVTHYRACWWQEGGDYEGPVQYPGRPIPDEGLPFVTDALRERLDELNRPFGREEIVKDLALPLAVAKRTGLKLYCGEFGVHRAAPIAAREAWYRDVVSVFDEFDIGWATWDYRGAFALVDNLGGSTGIAEILLGKPVEQ